MYIFDVSQVCFSVSVAVSNVPYLCLKKNKKIYIYDH